MRILPVLLGLCSAGFLHAQNLPILPLPTVPTAAGETSLTLDIINGIRFVPPSRVSVPVGERLQVSAPIVGTPLQWQKNGQPIPGATSNPLVISPVAASDAGTYTAVNTAPAGNGFTSQALVLTVGPTERFTNVALRGWVGGADQPFIGGFVVSTQGGSTSKKIIIRAIGPSLSRFGVTNFLKQPTLIVYDAAGREYNNQYAYTAVVGGLTYESDLANSLARCGAFPVSTAPGSRDLTFLRPFAAGSYTVHIGSADGTAGAVLLEIYEVP